MSRRILLILSIGASLIALGLFIQPIGSKLLNLGFLVALGSAFAAWMLLCWKNRTIRILMPLGLTTSATAFLLSGIVTSTTDGLQRSYVQNLRNLEGKRYVWGGENPRGIDCSGLPRHAFRHALRQSGHPFPSLEHWWFDTSALALSEGYRGFTTPLGLSGEIQTMPYDRLLPGDLAVTVGGAHVIVYLGDDLWIQADPGIGEVKTLNGRIDPNAWFTMPVTIHRWTALAK